MQIMLCMLYRKEEYDVWNAFAARAKNAHFFFHRSYMEYHKERFEDCSLMICNEKERLIALLPATKHGDELISHGGLTFGGFLVDEQMTVEHMLKIFDCVMDFLRQRGFRTWVYKCMPYIYYQYPADEDQYALFLHDATLIRRDVSAAVYMPKRYGYETRRKRAVKKGVNNGVVVRQSTSFEEYMALANDVLGNYHNAKAVHTGA